MELLKSSMGLDESSMAWTPSKHALTEPIQNLCGHAHSALSVSLRACPQTVESFRKARGAFLYRICGV